MTKPSSCGGAVYGGEVSRWRAQTTNTATHVCHGDAGFVALTQVLDQEAVFLPMWPAGLHSHITKPRAMPARSYLAVQVNVVAQAHVSGRDDSGGTISNHSDGAYHTSVQCSVHTLLRDTQHTQLRDRGQYIAACHSRAIPCPPPGASEAGEWWCAPWAQ